MGTRHLIAVFVNGEYKVAQYGQWDGYPTGQGVDVLNFLRTKSLKKFRKNVLKCTFYTEKELEEIYKQYCSNPGWINMEEKANMDKAYFELSRDCSAEILNMIQESGVGYTLKNSLEFAGDGLFCEWAYVIDLDKNTFEVYEGFKKAARITNEGRFAKLHKVKAEYLPVQPVASFALDTLPTPKEFVSLEFVSC